MFRFRQSILSLFIVIFLWTNIPITTTQAETNQTDEQTYLIKFKNLQTGIAALGDNLIHTYKFIPLASAKLTPSELSLLSEDSNIEYIEKNSNVTFSSETNISNALVEKGKEDTILQHEALASNEKNVKIGMLDTGIAREIIANVQETHSFVDDKVKNSFDQNHGTYLASVINQTAPNVTIYDLQVLNQEGVGTYESVIKAIEWSIENDMDIVQMSFGGEVHSLALAEAMLVAESNNILLIAASGNTSALEVQFPAKYNSVIAVGAINEQNVRLSTSNRGNELELVALGEGIDGLANNGVTIQLTGTSVAASQVVAVAALYMEQFPTLSAGAIRELLKASAISLGPMDEFGYGKVSFQLDNQEPLDEGKNDEEQTEETEYVEELEAEESSDTLIAERIKKIINGESLLEDSLEEIGQYRLEVERSKLELDRYIAQEQQRIEQHTAKLTISDLLDEFHLDKSEVQQLLDEGFTAQELYQFYWNVREGVKQENGLQMSLSSKQMVKPIKREPLNLSELASSEIEVKAGSDLYTEDVWNAFEEEVANDSISEKQQDDPTIHIDENVLNSDPEADKQVTNDESLIIEDESDNLQDLQEIVLEDIIQSKSVIQSTPEEEIIKPVERSSDAPYSIGLYNESVSLLSGGLTVQESDFTLPGRGGLSFTLSRTYNSNNAQLDEMDVGYTNNYGYFYNYKMSYSQRSITYKVTRTYKKYRVKYVCVAGKKTDNEVERINLGIHTNPAISFNTQYLADMARYEIVNKSPEILHNCDSPDKDRMYQYEYVYDDGARSNSYSSWSGSSLNYIEGIFSTEAQALADRTLMINGYFNAAGEGGDYYGGGDFEYKYIYTPTTGVYSQIVGETPYNKVSTDPLEKRFPIGKGWSWDIPYVKIDGGKTYVSLGDGSMYEISGTQLKNYTWSDLSFVNDTTVTYNSKKSAYALKSVYGLNYYFDTSGNLIMIRDRNNNETSFGYTNVSPYGEVLTSIVDAAKNSITIQYTNNQVKLTSDGRTVTYTKTTSNGKELLSQVTDPLNRVTTYSYSISPARFNLIGSNPTKRNDYVLLNAVQHPTGAKSKYTYETTPVKRFLRSNQVNEVYRLASRHDEVTYSDQTTERYNYASLVYETDMGATYGSDATISTTLFKNLLETKETYFKKYVDNTIGNVFYLTESTVDDGTIKQINTFTHDQSKHRVEPISSSQYYKNLITSTTTVPVTTSRVFDDYRNVTSETNAYGLTSTYTYFVTSRRLALAIQSVTNTQRVYTYFTRNTKGDVTEEISRENTSTGKLLQHVQYQYDNYGNVTLIRNKEQNRDLDTQIAYSSTYEYAYPTQVTRPFTNVSGVNEVQIIKATYNKARGTMASYTDGKNGTTNFTYDSLSRVKTIKHPDNSTYSVTYNDQLNEMTAVNEDGVKSYTKWNPLGLMTEQGFIIANKEEAKTKVGYDAYSRAVWEEDALGKRKVTSYDDWNRVTSVTLPSMIQSTISYDDINFVTETKDFEGKTLRETADRFGRPIKKELKNNNAYLTQWLGSYDTANRLISVQDGKNYITSYQYNVLGQLTKAVGADQYAYWYEYNRQGLLTRLTSSYAESTANEYDQLGRLIKSTDSLGKTEKYVYDKNNNLIQYTDRKGQVFTNTYNSRNFLTTKSGTAESVNYTYAASGLRKTMTDNGNRVTKYTYDPHTGMLHSIAYPDGKTIQYDYDAAGKLDSFTTPFLDKVTYEYDLSNRIHSIAWNGVNQATYNYEVNKPLQSIVQANGIKTDFGYDGLNRLQTLTHKQGNTVTRKYSYSYDANSNINQITELGNNTEQPIKTFTYDSMNRISTSSHFDERYSYDPKGNRKSLVSTNSIMPQTSANYVYDQWNRLKKVTTGDNKTVEYVYNGDGLMVERKENGVSTRYYYNGDKIIAEGTVGANNTVTLKASYLHGSSGLIMRENEADNTKAYYLMNGHGDVTEIRDNTGAVLNNYTYDIWGNVTSQTGSLKNPFLYSGEYWDDTTKLQYLRARWYDPSMGRFINEDTYKGELNNPISLNLYTYVANNPLKYIDPSGHKPVIWYDKEKKEYTYAASNRFLDGVQVTLGFVPFYGLIDVGAKYLNDALRDHSFSEISKKDIQKAHEKLGITVGLTTLEKIGDVSSSKVKKAVGGLASYISLAFSAFDVYSYLTESDVSWLVEDLFSPGLMVSNRKEQITIRYYFAANVINELIKNDSLKYSYSNGVLTHNLTKKDLDSLNDALLNFMMKTGAYENKGDY